MMIAEGWEEIAGEIERWTTAVLEPTEARSQTIAT